LPFSGIIIIDERWLRIDETDHDRRVDLFKRKTFNLGGSIAVRIPKEIADALSIKEGTEVNFSVKNKNIIISKQRHKLYYNKYFSSI